MLCATTGGPTLQPMFLYACPNKSVIFTCSDNKVTIIDLRVENHIPLKMMNCPIHPHEEIGVRMRICRQDLVVAHARYGGRTYDVRFTLYIEKFPGSDD